MIVGIEVWFVFNLTLCVALLDPLIYLFELSSSARSTWSTPTTARSRYCVIQKLFCLFFASVNLCRLQVRIELQLWIVMHDSISCFHKYKMLFPISVIRCCAKYIHYTNYVTSFEFTFCFGFRMLSLFFFHSLNNAISISRTFTYVLLQMISLNFPRSNIEHNAQTHQNDIGTTPRYTARYSLVQI